MPKCKFCDRDTMPSFGHVVKFDTCHYHFMGEQGNFYSKDPDKVFADMQAWGKAHPGATFIAADRFPMLGWVACVGEGDEEVSRAWCTSLSDLTRWYLDKKQSSAKATKILAELGVPRTLGQDSLDLTVEADHQAAVIHAGLGTTPEKQPGIDPAAASRDLLQQISSALSSQTLWVLPTAEWWDRFNCEPVETRKKTFPVALLVTGIQYHAKTGTMLMVDLPPDLLIKTEYLRITQVDRVLTHPCFPRPTYVATMPVPVSREEMNRAFQEVGSEDPFLDPFPYSIGMKLPGLPGLKSGYAVEEPARQSAADRGLLYGWSVFQHPAAMPIRWYVGTQEELERLGVLACLDPKTEPVMESVAVTPEPITAKPRQLTYCSFADKTCLGICILEGVLDPIRASMLAGELGINPGGQLMTAPCSEADQDIPAAIFESMWQNRNRLIPPEEARELFEAKSIREFQAEADSN